MRIAIVGAVVLVGCGDSPGGKPDAGEPDAGVDASPDATADGLACTPMGASGSVVVDGPSGAATLEVVFIAHDATGAVIERSAVMGSDATVTLTVPSCGMVTVFEDDPAQKSSKRALTWANVQPGDHLVHRGFRPVLVDRPVQVQLAPLAGATKYQITTACTLFSTGINFNPSPGPVDMTRRCPPGPASISVLATATTPTGTSAALAASTPLAAGTTIVTLPAYQPVPSVATKVRGTSAFANGRVLAQTLAIPAPEHVVIVAFAQATIAGAETTVAPIAMLTSPGMFALDISSDPMVKPQRVLTLFRGAATASASVDVDLAELPPVPAGAVDAATTRPTVTWGTDRPVTADAATIDLDEDADEAGHIRWTMVVPPRPGAVRFPELPADLLPPAVPALKGVSLLEASDVQSYDVARVQLDQLFVQPPGPGVSRLASSARY